MKVPLRVGAPAAPKWQFPKKSNQPENGGVRRIASLSAAAAIVVSVGAASAIFVDYLADRALARTADAPAIVKTAVAAEAVAGEVIAKAAAIAPEASPVKPAETRIAAAMPDAEAIAKVAIGPEHAIELPTDDPTASPIVHLDEISEPDDAFFIDATVPNTEPLVADTEADGSADETQTAAIAPDAANPALDEEPVKKPKRQKAAKAEPQAATQQTEVASLPGVDIGGLAGHRSDSDDNSASTVRTVTKSSQAKGGVAAGAARVTAAVNLRTSPRKGASVAVVVPAGSAVNVLSCDGWCQVVYNGKTGWVYKNFLTGAKAKPQKAAKANAAPEDTTQPAARKVQSSRL